jgi:hypothetical protein
MASMKTAFIGPKRFAVFFAALRLGFAPFFASDPVS